MWNPFLYPLIFPRIPKDNPNPPTIYQILVAIVNYGKEEITGTRNLAREGRYKIFDFDYPLTENISKEEFETMILNKFMMRRIGFETITAFKIQLCVKLNEIMPMYNKMFDFLDGWDIFKDGEVTTRDKDYNGSSNINSNVNVNSNNISDRRNSELPQDELDNIKDGKYMTNYNLDTDDSSSNSNSASSSSDRNNEHEVISRTPSDKMTLYKELMNNKKNIYSMIFQDLDSLFYQIV